MKVFKKPVDLLKLLDLTLSHVSDKLELEIKYRQKSRTYGFETGLSMEAFFREQIAQLFSNYCFDAGHVVDTEGSTCGECDLVIIRNDQKNTLLLPTSKQDRRVVFPVEITYGVIEVKESLTEKSLIAACEKIIAYKQLFRETRQIWPGDLDFRGYLNPRFGAVFFYEIAKGFDYSKLHRIFSEIHDGLDVQHYVNGIYINKISRLGWMGNPNTHQRSYSTEKIYQLFPEHAVGGLQPAGLRHDDTFSTMYHDIFEALSQIQLLEFDIRAYNFLDGKNAPPQSE